MTQSEDIVNGALEMLVEVTDPTDPPEEEVDEYAAGAVDPELAADMMAEEMARRAVELEGARFAVMIKLIYIILIGSYISKCHHVTLSLYPISRGK